MGTQGLISRQASIHIWFPYLERAGMQPQQLWGPASMVTEEHLTHEYIARQNASVAVGSYKSIF